VTTRPAAQQPKLASHDDHASIALVRACILHRLSCSVRSALTR